MPSSSKHETTPPEENFAEENQPGCFRNCLITGAILFILFCILLWFMLLRNRPLEISEETTYITEPKTADGKQIDYLRALEERFYTPEMTTDRNGYRLLVEALGPHAVAGNASPELLRKLYGKLGLATVTDPTMTYQGPSQFLEQAVTEEEGRPELLMKRLKNPWTFEEMSIMQPWLEENGPALDLLGEAVRKPEFVVPIFRESKETPLFALEFPNYLQLIVLGRGLQVRANFRIGTGDLDGAIDDILALQRLGQHFGKIGLIHQTSWGLFLEGMAAGIPIAGNPEHPPTAAQLSRLRDQWMKAPPRVAREKVIEGERFILLELGQRVAHGELTAETPFYNMMGYDWNAFMARINEYFEPPPSGNAPRNSALEWLYPRSRSRLLAEQSVTIFTPTLSSFQETCRRAESTDRFYLIALAMLLYEREHGTLPPAWTEDEAGNRLHSWRVLLLPYLGEEELYEKILLDEPWDSEHNRRFHATTVSFYRYPGEKADAHATRCAVLVGDETAFEGAAGKKLESLGPFYYNTILVVETQQSVHWMDPSSEVDWEAAKRYLIGAMPIPTIAGSRTLGSSHRGGMHAAVSGGCVENFFDNASLKVLEQAAVGELDPSNILDEEASGPER